MEWLCWWVQPDGSPILELFKSIDYIVFIETSFLYFELSFIYLDRVIDNELLSCYEKGWNPTGQMLYALCLRNSTVLNDKILEEWLETKHLSIFRIINI